MRLAFDLESDGLLPSLSRVWSLVVKDVDTGHRWSCHDDMLPALAALAEADEVIGHNIIAFDLPALRTVFPAHFTLKPGAKIVDTLVAARLRYTVPHLRDEDFARIRRKKPFPNTLIGHHSLEAWGHRIGVLKGAYGKTSDWSRWSPEMQQYCEQDVDVTVALWRHLKCDELPALAFDIETTLADYLARQERNGVVFAFDRALALHGRLVQERADLDDTIRTHIPLAVVPGKEFTPKRDNRRYGYVAGASACKLDIVEFNPGSRPQLARALRTRYGWESPEVTETGLPKIDDDILGGASSIPSEVREALRRRFLLSKRIGQVADGDEAWTNAARFDEATGLHFIHHRCNPAGTITHRAAHSSPNLAQVPRVGKPFGEECRGLFTVPSDWWMVGADASGLELRCLAHYLARYDGGNYVRIVTEGDVHAATRDALSLEPTKENRDVSKTFIYAYLYGAGDGKLGSILFPEASEVKQRKVGARLRTSFQSRLPGVARLVEAVQDGAKRGWLRMPDGRTVQVRSPHAALNTLLQGSGAIICKLWIARMYPKLVAALGEPSWRGRWTPLLWVHDEVQIAVRSREDADLVAQIAVETIREVGDELKWRCPLAGEAKVGRTWAETH